MATEASRQERGTQGPLGELAGRVPPHSVEAERAVLGSVLLDPRTLDDVATVLVPEDFYVDAHRRIYARLLEMHAANRTIDLMLLVEELRRHGEFETVGGAPYLAEIAQSVAVASHAVYYAEIVRNHAFLRALIQAGTDIVRDAFDLSLEPREILNRAEERILAVRDRRSTGDVVPVSDVLFEAFQMIDRRMQGEATGVPTGFTDLDKLTGGLHDSELIILAARPSMGKTALATNIAEHVSVDAGLTTLFVSLEMSRLELIQRMLCSRGKINGHKFRSGFLSAEDREKLVRAAGELSRGKLLIDDSPSRTVTEIAAVARRLKRREGLRLIVIDYLQLIEPDNPKDPRQEQVAKITRRLKTLARELKIPILCLAQLNRQTEVVKDNRPRLSHLRESGAIEQDADVVMFVHREEYYHTREEAQARGLCGLAEVIVAKQRNGPVGDVKLVWREEFTRFENAAPAEYSEVAYGDFAEDAPF
ncbi:Replicative DNA helicase [Thermogutta terrifontis]|uniref:Replicative DNA helicase n=1 Tax=Thermogutta terrifontis TaxID=1331910 RepID=A0A286RJW7_9BACT|nr:replicative DNA helicase [Thermogutta terrifontis]ASV76234.1 Replicative DNA helicase [Thermogutta terrifontis]